MVNVGETDKEIDFRSSQRRTMIELVPWEHSSGALIQFTGWGGFQEESMSKLQR